MPFAEDFSDFFDTDDFATQATYGAGLTVNGIFEKDYQEDLNIPGLRPVFTCAESDIPTLDVNETITIDSTVYTVGEKQPIDNGLVRLILRT